MNGNDPKKTQNAPLSPIQAVENPASQPHGSTEDQVNEMESEGQAAKQGQGSEVVQGGQVVRMTGGESDKKRR